MPSSTYIALIHHPVVNKEGKIVTTSVTNFDLHDLARTSCTYGVKKVFVVTPVPEQKTMIDYLKDYWENGKGADFNPTRKRAFALIDHAFSLEETCLTIEKTEGIRPFLVATSAKKSGNSRGYIEARELQSKENRPWLLLFGTGYGMDKSVMELADLILHPIVGPTDYNHLPVRSAVAVILDRLIAERI